MAGYKLTEDAQQDLRELKGFSLQQFGKLVTREYLAGMRITMQHLANMPGMGTLESVTLHTGVWSFPYMSHMLFYKKAETGIVVIGILHQSRLPELLLKRR
ncbi:MAG TPA: type II toxin-antitoxin system RelE/ParE family toxin [Buttiauxella sp.]|uniref:type II toxin-antitoxin system RelE/ParE family toxin n=1 Tax=Buttiauxella sp. TaxID=1972222 RepID=UPI002B47C8E2|nr:type II toxin-antitoxin system RelE/ParE family toxin [Buttiauxella sp.]HKM96688.1 type II toxin-antitoxin system RelE/ParE family toxin [Buttiauxella sp.]